MNARTPRSRVRARALRAALCGTSALVLLAGVALPVGFSPSSMEPFQKAAHAKGGGGGGGGPPDHSNAGGNGNGRGGSLSSAGHGDGEDDDHDGHHDGHHDGKNKLGKLNAANASPTALLNANANSTVGQIAIYKQRVLDGLEDEPTDETITTFADAKAFLETFANKLVTEGVVATLNELLGLAPFDEEPEPEE
ncbi:MAG: hypothetical protein IIC97_04265 [Chloroflexi bacterium]|nr:hypothetical protein [Chloroflexota bacterium]